ncbi:heavy metal-associated domain-containing protein [Thermus scotoductus]|uniref:heavy metal-associated domain-containing protein n=1 Tax=Thermus scotoductus TaxID=37636 RepID=UPI0034538A01
MSFDVRGLGCGGAGATTLERALTQLAGVKQVYVNPLTERAYLEYDPLLISLETIREVVKRLGYEAGSPEVYTA